MHLPFNLLSAVFLLLVAIGVLVVSNCFAIVFYIRSLVHSSDKVVDYFHEILGVSAQVEPLRRRAVYVPIEVLQVISFFNLDQVEDEMES